MVLREVLKQRGRKNSDFFLNMRNLTNIAVESQCRKIKKVLVFLLSFTLKVKGKKSLGIQDLPKSGTEITKTSYSHTLCSSDALQIGNEPSEWRFLTTVHSSCCSKTPYLKSTVTSKSLHSPSARQQQIPQGSVPRRSTSWFTDSHLSLFPHVAKEGVSTRHLLVKVLILSM